MFKKLGLYLTATWKAFAGGEKAAQEAAAELAQATLPKTKGTATQIAELRAGYKAKKSVVGNAPQPAAAQAPPKGYEETVQGNLEDFKATVQGHWEEEWPSMELNDPKAQAELTSNHERQVDGIVAHGKLPKPAPKTHAEAIDQAPARPKRGSAFAPPSAPQAGGEYGRSTIERGVQTKQWQEDFKNSTTQSPLGGRRV